MGTTTTKRKNNHTNNIFSSVRNMISPSSIDHKELFSKAEIDKMRIQNLSNEYGESVTKIDGEIPVDFRVKNNDRFLFISYDQSILTHGLHKYPAKFFPELPRWIIHRYTKENNWVLDPFAGSGTANLESLLAHRNSVAIDVDPFSRFLTKVKTTPLNISALRNSYIWLKRRMSQFQSRKGIITKKDIPLFPYRDNWFYNYIINELAYIKKNILNINNLFAKSLSNKTVQDIIDFYLVCFSSIIRSVSNADDNCTRTVIRKKLNKIVNRGDALKRFIKTIDNNVSKMVDFSKVCPKNIKLEIPNDNDAREIKYPDNYFHLAVTSPPYVNAVDYPRTHQLEIYWLGIETGSLAPLKKIHVGTETVSSIDYKNLQKTGFKEIDKIIKAIYVKDPRRSYILYKFLIDMQKNLLEVKRVLRPGGRYAIVVGNNRMRGILVESWKYIMEMGIDLGFKVETYFASEIIRHFIKVPREERIETDWVIIFRKGH